MIRSTLRCLYLHGFKSGPQSHKAQLMTAFFKEHDAQHQLVVPTLPVEPKAAIELAKQHYLTMMEDVGEEHCLVVGSSLGGFYATWLLEHHGGQAVVINPAIRPYELLTDYIGVNHNYHTGESFVVTADYLDQMLEIDVPALSHPERCLLLQQTGDETLDYREACKKYLASPSIIEGGGDHSYQGFDWRIPTLLHFAQRTRCQTERHGPNSKS